MKAVSFFIFRIINERVYDFNVQALRAFGTCVFGRQLSCYFKHLRS